MAVLANFVNAGGGGVSLKSSAMLKHW